MDVVSEILQKNGNFKPITVDKYIEFDLGALLAVDSNQLDEDALKRTKEDYLKSLTRDNTQLLFNKIWDLENERREDAIVAKLPKQRFILPRFKPVPKPRPLTKWQQFAKEKGIDKKKKSKLSWDEQLQKWIPLYGFKRTTAQKEKDWVLEVPDNANPFEDQFAKKITAKSEKVAKNELQRLRNIAKARNVKVPRFGLTNPDVSSAKDLQTAVTVAKSSTASLGKFQNKLPHEKEARGVSAITPGSASRKRKLQSVSGADEKTEVLAIVDAVLNKKPKLNIEKAVAKQINQEQLMRAEEKKTAGRGSSSSSSRKSRGGKKPPPNNNSGKKPRNANKKGQRKGKLGGGGRKRR